jgi:hypothetical protein
MEYDRWRPWIELHHQGTCRMMPVSGVAKLFTKDYFDQWVAGIWRSNIPGGLLWMIQDAKRYMNNTSLSSDLLASGDAGYVNYTKSSETIPIYKAPSWRTTSAGDPMQCP